MQICFSSEEVNKGSNEQQLKEQGTKSAVIILCFDAFLLNQS